MISIRFGNDVDMCVYRYVKSEVKGDTVGVEI
jgi:hypothetical protein